MRKMIIMLMLIVNGTPQVDPSGMILMMVVLLMVRMMMVRMRMRMTPMAWCHFHDDVYIEPLGLTFAHPKPQDTTPTRWCCPTRFPMETIWGDWQNEISRRKTEFPPSTSTVNGPPLSPWQLSFPGQKIKVKIFIISSEVGVWNWSFFF